MTDIKEGKFYQKALELARSENDENTNVEYLGDYEGYEVYKIINPNEAISQVVDSYIMASEDGVNKSYYHESVAIARKFKI